MTSAAIQSEWLKTRKRPLTLWLIGILLAVVFIRPPVMAGLSGLVSWADALFCEAVQL